MRRRLHTLIVASFAASMQVASAHSADLAVATELGITAESMVIANFSVEDARRILGNLENATAAQAALGAAHQNLKGAIDNLAAKDEALRERRHDPDARDDRRNAAADVTAGRAALSDAQRTLFDLAMAGSPSNKTQAVRDFHAGIMHNVPSAFRASMRNAIEWLAIARALRHEQRCRQSGDDLRQDYELLLERVRSEPMVALAQVRLDSNLHAMQQTFEDWASR